MEPEFGAQPNSLSNDCARQTLLALTSSQSGSDKTARPAPHSTSAPAPVSWHSQNQVGIQEISYLGTFKEASSRSCSSVVNDGGDAKQLAHTATPRRIRSFIDTQRSTEFTHEVLSLNLSYLGGGVPSDAPGHPETLGSDLTSQGEGQAQDHDHDKNAGSPLTVNDDLEHDLRAAFQISEEQERRRFLPLDQLDRIVTGDRVKRELQKHNIVPLGELDHYTGQIWAITKSPNQTSRRKIFAILVLLQKVTAILDFIRYDIYDGDLPFVLTDGSGPGYSQLSRTRKGGVTEPIAFCQDPNAWPTHLLECFDTYQWQLLAPYFELSTKSQPKVFRYKLKSNTILPLIEVDKENASAHSGGFGDVWRVKIHPAHHNCCTTSADHSGNPSYAVKRLRHNDEDAFEAEVSTLKRLGEQDRLHLIRLLATYSYRNEFHLLFPWADGGNLRDLWEKGYPGPVVPPRDERLAQWLSGQILGVVEGLKMIHTSEIQPSSRGASLNPTDVNRKYGRHGDLKPENILWFKTYHSDDKACFMGLLKISDFGMTSFHDSQTRSMLEARSIGVSPTYRAPEYDIKGHVSQKYDIWTLGCVLIEFATWYILGWKGVDSFSKSRTDNDNQEFKQDVFFTLEQHGNNGQSGFCARMKRAVANHFNDLRKHSDCPDFIIELLDFIETDLLRMDPENRAMIGEIVIKVKKFHQQCQADIKYCTKRMKTVTTRVRTDLSELEASVPLYSLEMQERLRQTVASREEDGKAEPGSQRESRDLGSEPTEVPDSPTRSKRPWSSTSKGKEPERMPTVEEIRTSTIIAQHSTHEPQQPLPGITVNGAVERDDQHQQSEASMELFTQTEMAHEQDKKLQGLQRWRGPPHSQVGAEDDTLATVPVVDTPQQPAAAGPVLPPTLVSMPVPEQFQNFPPLQTQEQRMQGLSPPGDDNASGDHCLASTATPTTIKDPIKTAKTSQPLEIDPSTAEPGRVDTPMAQLPVVNPRAQSEPHADLSPASNIHASDAQDGDSGPHPQGEQRRSHEANARHQGQRPWNPPPSATHLTSNGRSVRRAGSEQAVEKATVDHSNNVSAKIDVQVASTGRRTRFRDILRSLLCCVPSPRQ